jgi:8-oxo-dGTP pyrophosphatase MutT (NUDIX family)
VRTRGEGPWTENSLRDELASRLPELTLEEVKLLSLGTAGDFDAVWVHASIPRVWRKNFSNMREGCARRNYALPLVKDAIEREVQRRREGTPAAAPLAAAWTVQKGEVDAGEDSLQAARREVYEEAEVPLDDVQSAPAALVHCFQEKVRKPHRYLLHLREGSPRAQEDEWPCGSDINRETVRARWWSLEELGAEIKAGMVSLPDWQMDLLRQAHGALKESYEMLPCKDCPTKFPFTASEKAYFKTKGFQPPVPQRCPKCRARHKQQRDASSGGGGGSGAVAPAVGGATAPPTNPILIAGMEAVAGAVAPPEVPATPMALAAGALVRQRGAVEAASLEDSSRRSRKKKSSDRGRSQASWLCTLPVFLSNPPH